MECKEIYHFCLNLCISNSFRFALVYQLTKPVVKKTATQSSIPDSGTKIASKDTKPSEDGSGTG